MTRYRLLIPLGLFALALAGALWVRSRFQLAGSLLPAASSEEGADDGDHSPPSPTCEPILGTPCPSREAPSGFAVGRGECEGIAPTPVGALCKSRVAGCAGLLRPLCKRACGYCRSLVEGAVCRARHLAAAEGPNAACGRHGMDDEWEPVEPLPVTLVGEVGGGGGRGCPGLPAESGWGLPRYSARDSCFTHLDRDFLFDLAVGAEALPSLSPANLVSDRSHAGRDLEVETEWMYLFAPFRGTRLFAADDTGLAKPAALLPRLRWTDEGGHARDLGVPMPGDPMAAQGVLAADCGHLDASGFARTELHPALALAWLHRESDKAYTLWVRAASHLATDQRSHRLQPLRAVLPLPGPAKVASFSWDYSLSGYRVAIDRSCVRW